MSAFDNLGAQFKGDGAASPGFDFDDHMATVDPDLDIPGAVRPRSQKFTVTPQMKARAMLVKQGEAVTGTRNAQGRDRVFVNSAVRTRQNMN